MLLLHLSWFRVTCVSDNDQVFVTVNDNTLSAMLSNLRYYTQYNCCVEATYSGSRENILSCNLGQTQEGRKLCSILFR